MAGDEPEQEELEAQMEIATEAIRVTVLRPQYPHARCRALWIGACWRAN
jgi:hypothetical protein